MLHWWIELFYQMHAVSIAVLFNLITWLHCRFISVTHLLVLKNTRNLQEKPIRYKNQAKLFLYINLSKVRKKIYIYACLVPLLSPHQSLMKLSSRHFRIFSYDIRSLVLLKWVSCYRYEHGKQEITMFTDFLTR